MTATQIQNTQIPSTATTTEKDLQRLTAEYTRETAYQTALLNEQTSQLVTQIRQLVSQLSQTRGASS